MSCSQQWVKELVDRVVASWEDKQRGLVRLPSPSLNKFNIFCLQIVLYFETLGRGELCPTISAYRTSRVANQKPASVIVYDYYDQTRRARSFYESPRATLCDICDPATSDQCPDDGCPDRPTPSFSTRYSTFEGDVDVLGSHSTRSLNPMSLASYLILVITCSIYHILR